MIPRLTPSHLAPAEPRGLFDALVEAGFCGDLEAGAAARIVQSTDNSIYQIVPEAILYPSDSADLRILAEVLHRPEHRHHRISPRGGGTGTNGQSLGSGLVVDCSRHMTRILEIDVARRRVTVEAGVVKDQLNRALAPHGLFFAPELSTSNRATIGGMVSTDACGQGSCLYGKTSDHVLGLGLVLSDGSHHWSEPVDADGLDRLCARDDRIGAATRQLVRIERDEAENIARIFPRLNRFMTGYDLAHLRDADGRFDMNAVLCGSEGTLALIAEVELNLLPLPARAALVCIQYADFNTALEDARLLMGLKVASVETLDEKVLSLARGDAVWQGISRFFPKVPGSLTDGINLVEILADSDEALEQGIERVNMALAADRLEGRGTATIARDPADIAAIWQMRKRAVGLLGNVSGPARPMPFVEDTAVPPENLAAYIREFRALLDDEGVSYGMFGHVDAGVLHVRPALDLTVDADRARIRRISDAVVALTQKYGGVLWGEHGKGLRSEYVPEYFGPLYPALQAIKAAFDPDNRLNPGRVATPAVEQPLSRIDEAPLRGDFDRQIPRPVRDGFDNGPYCNGNGACVDFDATNAMCPSYKATRDRRHSPKGRAALIREWLRLLAENGVEPQKLALAPRPAFSGIRRLWNSLNPANRDDFSHKVRRAMDGCLACKACAGQCPVKVDVPAFRAKFLHLYYGRYLRPLRHHLVGGIETLLPLAARFGPLYGLAVGPGRGMLRRVAGLTALPGLASRALRAQVAAIPIATPERLAARGPDAGAVVLVADPFLDHFDPAPVLAAARIARAAGASVWRSPPVANGKPRHVLGFLGQFADIARRAEESLQPLVQAGATLVGVDPSLTLAWRAEHAGAGHGVRVLLPQEWLAGLSGLPRLAKPGGPLRLMLHCTERSNLPTAAEDWRRVFGAAGLDLALPATGCCGMAGSFGHDVANRPVSERLFDLSWRPVLETAPEGAIDMATGYSCRAQAGEMAGRRLPHPLEVMAELLPGSQGASEFSRSSMSSASGRLGALRSGQTR